MRCGVRECGVRRILEKGDIIWPFGQVRGVRDS